MKRCCYLWNINKNPLIWAVKNTELCVNLKLKCGVSNNMRQRGFKVLCMGYVSQRSCTSVYEYQTTSQSERSKKICGQWRDRLLLQARSMRAWWWWPDTFKYLMLIIQFYSHAVSGWVTEFFGMFKIWKWICSNFKG